MVEGGARVVEGGPKVGEGGQRRWAGVPSMWAERDEPGALRSCLELAATIGKIILLSCAGFVCMEERGGGRRKERGVGGYVQTTHSYHLSEFPHARENTRRNFETFY